MLNYSPIENALTPEYLVKECTVVSLRGEKAIRVVSDKDDPNANGPSVKYFVSRGPISWLLVVESYTAIYPIDASFLIGPTKSTPELRAQISAIAAVMDTLKFTH